jgi:type III secretion HrpO family protein
MNIDVIYFTKLALYTVLIISLPVMVASFVIGLLVGIFQALTQIQDQTFSFVVKLIAICIVLAVTTVWVSHMISNFVDIIYNAPVVNK